MNDITELAKLFKERENGVSYSPVFGTIIDVADLKIRINDRIVLDKSYLKSCFDIYATDEYDNYIYYGKTVVMLPYANNQKYIVMGVVEDVS